MNFSFAFHPAEAASQELLMSVAAVSALVALASLSWAMAGAMGITNAASDSAANHAGVLMGFIKASSVRASGAHSGRYHIKIGGFALCVLSQKPTTQAPQPA
jgi:hypothetical protein